MKQADSKHTPGPWFLNDAQTLIQAPGDASGQHAPLPVLVAYTAAVDLGVQCRANARLISAAPDLLEALRWYVENDEVSDVPGEEFWLDGRERARAAIAKAAGTKQSDG